MASTLSLIEENIRKKDIKDISNKDLIYYLYYITNNSELKVYDQKKIEDYLYKINYSYFYENIFSNKGNYSTISLFIIGLMIPFYMNYPKFYNLGGLGFIIGISSFLLLYQQVNTLFGMFFPSAARLFIVFSVIFYLVFFILYNKLNHITLFFISSIVSFCIINYFYKILLTLPTKGNIYNKLKAKYEEKKNVYEYDINSEKVCNEVIKRFGLKLPSGNMLYSYLTVFKIGDNNQKLYDFLTCIFSPLITLIYNFYLGNFLESITNTDYNNQEMNVIPLIGGTAESKNYLGCKANYVLPIEFNFNSFLHEYYDEDKLDDDTYRIFIKGIKRINYELLEKYQPKFVKLEDVEPAELMKQLKKNAKDKNHILVQLEDFFKSKGIPFELDQTNLDSKGNKNNQGNTLNDYIKKLKDFIDNSEIQEKDKINALELYHKILQTLDVSVNTSWEKDNEFIDDAKLAIEVLLENENIDKNNKKLLKNLCENYVSYFQKYTKEKKFYGYNYNLWTFKYFNQEIRLGANKWFYSLVRIISVYILFARPITSPWFLSILVLLPYIRFEQYVKYFDKSNIMKYLSMGVDTEYFIQAFENNVNNNNIIKKSKNTILKVILYLLILTPFLQFFNNVFYGQTFSPLYMNIFWQAVFIINLIGNYMIDSKNTMVWNIIYWFIVFIISIIIYFVKK